MKPTFGQWTLFGGPALIHYGAVCGYFYLWRTNQTETPVLTTIFFIGLLAWAVQIGLCFYFRKRSPVLARLCLFVFVSSLLFSFLWTSPTD